MERRRAGSQGYIARRVRGLDDDKIRPRHITHVDASEVRSHSGVSAAVAGKAASLGRNAAQSSSDAAWAELWKGDIEIGGDDQLQSEVRASRFYLLASVGERAWAPSPAGLSSDNYGGHVFWDNETWMWPSIIAQDPSIAKAVLQYRADRLNATEGAAYNALHTHEWDPASQSFVEKSYGDGSALRFPWEGGLDGREQTTSLFFGGHEIHITADVALAFWQYYQATGDKTWLKDGSARNLAQIVSACHGTMFNSLPVWCREVGTCPGSVGWTSRCR